MLPLPTAISLPQLTCLSMPHLVCDVALHLDSPKLQSPKVGSMDRIVSFTGSAPSLAHLTIRSNVWAPSSRSCLDEIVNICGQPRLACRSRLTSLELQYVSLDLQHDSSVLGRSVPWQYGVEELGSLTSLTRLVTWGRSADLNSLPEGLRNLMVVGCQIDITAVAQRFAHECVWRLESLHMIALDREGQHLLFNHDLDLPWGMKSLRQWEYGRGPGTLYAINLWLREVLKEVDEAEALFAKDVAHAGDTKVRLMLICRRDP